MEDVLLRIEPTKPVGKLALTTLPCSIIKKFSSTDDRLLQQHPPVVVKIPDGHFRSLLVENLLQDTAYLYSVRALNKSGLGTAREATMKIEHVGSRPPSGGR